MEAEGSRGLGGIARDLMSSRLWGEQWGRWKLPASIRTQIPIYSKFDRLFRSELPADPSWRILEIGCAPGRWMDYFAKRFGYHTTGIDYSELGCAVTRRNLRLLGTDGRVVCGDFWNPPFLRSQFDFVYSLGVIEHFRDATAAISAHLSLCKDGGLLFIEVPNFAGLNGSILRRIDPARYRQHEAFELANLIRAVHETGKAEVIRAEFFGGWDLSPSYLLHHSPWLVRQVLHLINQTLCAVMGMESRALSPFIGVFARKRR